MKTKQPKYRIEMTCVDFVKQSRAIHRYAFEGMRPTEANAKKFRDQMNSSISENGTNSHLVGKQSHYSNAQIVEQKTGKIVSAYISPKFELV